MTGLAAREKTCPDCGGTLYHRRRSLGHRRGFIDAWLHVGTHAEACPEPTRFGPPSPPCPRCGRMDCDVTGNPREWRCWDCEHTFRVWPADEAYDLEQRADRHGHQPSTLIVVNGTRALCAEPRMNAAMAVAIFHDVIRDDLTDTLERRPA